MSSASSDWAGRMRVFVEHRFAAPPAHVWELITDVPRMAQFSPEVVAATWINGRRTFRATNRRGDLQWDVTGHVLVSEPPTTFVWCVSDPDHRSATWTYTLTSDGPGTLVRQEFQHGPGPSMIRAMIERGADPATTVTWRSQMLETDMADVLTAADRCLSMPPTDRDSQGDLPERQAGHCASHLQ